ncbi:hypothetical protein Lepto7376_0978 [[Leptolyngbya] sp. PCC 7376]|uniref:hypothetical protein n=1 Tax=[Leptolyngbya] sp. PCC 7376 TaxID=111781 RepID=UPI00029ED5A4|nr:hypothetical protein [[Leptolyngbya] sp. PCC 7376]AFY37350.1 hypothetical protein Lepto7376_0978 [[Leptolyngbya] sp. PCC 7376]
MQAEGLRFSDPNIDSESTITKNGFVKHLFTYGSFQGQPPIIPSIGIELKSYQIALPYPPTKESYSIGWEVSSPRMPNQRGVYLIECFQEKEQYYFSVSSHEWPQGEEDEENFRRTQSISH